MQNINRHLITADQHIRAALSRLNELASDAILFLVDKENIYKILKKSFIFVLILIIVISFSRNPEDSNLYHNSYIALINSDKISFGISNLHFRFTLK